jgi:hypothetical protein
LESARLGLAAEHPDRTGPPRRPALADAPMRRCALAKLYSGRLPPILTRRLRDGAPDGDRQAVFNALIAHYRLTGKWEDFQREPKGSPLRSSKEAASWRELALLLAQDFIKACHPTFKFKIIDKLDEFQDWVAAGGSKQDFPSDSTKFYQAQLVEVIQKREAESGKSRAWVFCWFANEAPAATSNSKEANDRHLLLPRPYRKRGTSGSLKQAYNSIPRAVRNNPRGSLPRR